MTLPIKIGSVRLRLGTHS